MLAANQLDVMLMFYRPGVWNALFRTKVSSRMIGWSATSRFLLVIIEFLSLSVKVVRVAQKKTKPICL